MQRLLLGLLAAALWLPAFMLFSEWPGGAVVIAMFTVPLTLFVAAPLAFLLRKRLTLLLSMGFGTAVGAIGALALWLMTNSLAAANWAPLFLGIGMLSAVVFWVVGVWRNPHVSRGSAEAT